MKTQEEKIQDQLKIIIERLLYIYQLLENEKK